MEDWLLLLIGAIIMAFGIAAGGLIGVLLYKTKSKLPKEPIGMSNIGGIESVELTMEPSSNIIKKMPSFNESKTTLVDGFGPDSQGSMENHKYKSLQSLRWSFYTAEPGDDDYFKNNLEDKNLVGDSTLELTPIDQIKIRLKGLYNPEEHSDFFLHRFLRARKNDIDNTETMLRNYFKWREEIKVDQIVEGFAFTEAKQVFELYPQFYHKTDKKGRTIYVEQMKNLDYNKLMSITTTERMLIRHIREYEKFTRYRLVACSIKQGENIENGFTIIDLKGVPLSQFNQVRKTLQMLSSITSDYYPETLGTMFVINAPMLFTAIWKVIKQMLDEHTVSKINILGSNYRSQLLEHVDQENLPEFYGGTCKCPGGCENSDLGPWNDGTVEGFPQEKWEFKIKDNQ